MRSAVITIVAHRHRQLLAQRVSLQAGTMRPDLHVVVALGDPAIDSVLAAEPDPDQRAPTTLRVDVPGDPRGLPLAAGRNAGAAAAIAAGADLLIFLDVDCLAGPELLERYADAAARRPDSLLSGPVTYLSAEQSTDWTPSTLTGYRAPHPARPDPPAGELVEADPTLFWSLSFALTGETWDRIGGFDDGYVGYGAEDTDFARTAVTRGVAVVWVGRADAYHQHHPTSSPPVQHVAAVLRNGARYAQRWGDWPMPGWLGRFEQLGLVRRDGAGWRRSPAIRVLSVPATHPYVDAVQPDIVVAAGVGRTTGWQPDPALDPAVLRDLAGDIDVVHVHFGYDHLAPDALERWLVELDALGLALVVTVHDLRNPHHATPDRHEAHLRALLGAADEVLTLTDSAASEIADRFGRGAQVLAHPSLLDADVAVPDHAVGARPTVLVPLKSLRRNVCEPAAIVAGVVQGALPSGARVLVDLHPEVVADSSLTPVHELAEAGQVELTVHPRRTDADLRARLAGAHVLVLPYRFGTHSGWVELARDVGTRVVAPSCGYYAEQWPAVIGYGNDERHGLDRASLAAAVRRALHEPRPRPAERSQRVAESAQIRAAHEIVYRRALRSATVGALR